MPLPIKSFAAVGIFVFLHRFIFIYALLITIFHRFGMTPMMISSLIIIHDISKILCDPYTGVLADKYGIKKVLIVGIAAKIVGTFAWAIHPNYYTFLIGMSLIGVGRSCVVGKIDSYGYNLLFSKNMADKFSKLLAVIMVADALAATLSGLVAAALYKIGHLKIVLAGTIISMFFNIIFIIWGMPDDFNNAPRLYRSKTLKFIFKEALTLIAKDNKLLLITLIASLPANFITIYSNLGKMVMSDIKLSAETIYIIYSIEHIIPVIISSLMFFMKGSFYKSVKISMIIMITHAFLSIILAYKYGNYFILSVVMYFAIFPIINVTLKNNLEARLQGNIRATVNSFSSLMGSILKIYSFALVGIVSGILSYKAGILAVTLSNTAIITIAVYFYCKNCMKEID